MAGSKWEVCSPSPELGGGGMAKWQGATATRGEGGWAGGMQFYTGGFFGDKFSDVKDGAVYPRCGGTFQCWVQLQRSCLRSPCNTFFFTLWGAVSGGTGMNCCACMWFVCGGGGGGGINGWERGGGFAGLYLGTQVNRIVNGRLEGGEGLGGRGLVGWKGQ